MSEPLNTDDGTTDSWLPWSVSGSLARKVSRTPAGPAPLQRGAPGAVSPLDQDVVRLDLTGLLDTEVRVRVTDDPARRFRWSLAAGVERSDALHHVPAQLHACLDQLETTLSDRGLGTISRSWVDGNRRHHFAPGRATLASLLRREASVPGPGIIGRSERDTIVDAGRGIGTVLRALRDVDISDTPLGPPAAPARLSHWLTTGDGPFAASIMHEILTTHLGQRRIDEVVGWAAELPHEHLAIGRNAPDVTVISESSAPDTLLIGDEICAAPRDYDLSCALGELFVLERDTHGLPAEQGAARQASITACRDAVLSAYGPSEDLILTGRMTALHVLLQLHDSAAYLDTQREALAAEAAALVDDAR